jgi:hypothetical protein
MAPYSFPVHSRPLNTTVMMLILGNGNRDLGGKIQMQFSEGF